MSLMAPATVPAASSDACSDEAPHATVALREMPEIFICDAAVLARPVQCDAVPGGSAMFANFFLCTKRRLALARRNNRIFCLSK